MLLPLDIGHWVTVTALSQFVYTVALFTFLVVLLIIGINTTAGQYHSLSMLCIDTLWSVPWSVPAPQCLLCGPPPYCVALCLSVCLSVRPSRYRYRASRRAT